MGVLALGLSLGQLPAAGENLSQIQQNLQQLRQQKEQAQEDLQGQKRRSAR